MENKSMKCPKCNNEIVIKNQDTSHNSRNEKKYDRTIYCCEKDDIWINLEVPKKV